MVWEWRSRRTNNDRSAFLASNWMTMRNAWHTILTVFTKWLTYLTFNSKVKETMLKWNGFYLRLIFKGQMIPFTIITFKSNKYEFILNDKFSTNVTLFSFYFNLTLIWQNTKTSGNQAQQVLARYDGSSKVSLCQTRVGHKGVFSPFLPKTAKIGLK